MQREFESLREFILSSDEETLCSTINTLALFIGKAVRDLVMYVSAKKDICLRNFFEISLTLSMTIGCALGFLGFDYSSIPHLAITNLKNSDGKVIDDFWIRSNWVTIFELFRKSEESIPDRASRSIVSSLRNCASKISTSLFAADVQLSNLITVNDLYADAIRPNFYRVSVADLLSRLMYYSIMCGGASGISDCETLLTSILSVVHTFGFDSQLLASKTVAMLYFYKLSSGGGSIAIVRSLHHKIKSGWGAGTDIDASRAKTVSGALKALGAIIEIGTESSTDPHGLVANAFERLLEHFDVMSTYIGGVKAESQGESCFHSACGSLASANAVFSALIDSNALIALKSVILERKDNFLSTLKKLSSSLHYSEAARNIDAVVQLQASSVHLLGRLVTFLFNESTDRGRFHYVHYLYVVLK